MSFLKQHSKNSCPNCLQEYNGSSHVCASSAVVKSSAAVPAPEALFNMPMLRTWVLAFDHTEPEFPTKVSEIAKIPNFGAAAKYFYEQRKVKLEEGTSVKDVEQMYARWAHLCILGNESPHYAKIVADAAAFTAEAAAAFTATWNAVEEVPDAFVHFVNWENRANKSKYFDQKLRVIFSPPKKGKDPPIINATKINTDPKKLAWKNAWKKACGYLRILTTPLGYNVYKAKKTLPSEKNAIREAIKTLWKKIKESLSSQMADYKARAVKILEYLLKSKADIYLLQEVDEKIAGELGKIVNSKYGSKLGIKWDGGDLAIIYSKKKFRQPRTIHLEPESTDNTGGQYFQVLDLNLKNDDLKLNNDEKKKEEKLRIINCHLDSKKNNRKIWGHANFQIKGEKNKATTLRKVKATANQNLFKGWLAATGKNIKCFILGGDFNCTVAEANDEFFDVLDVDLPSSTKSTTATNQPYCPCSMNNFSSDHLAVNGTANNNDEWSNIGTPYIIDGTKPVEKPGYHSSKKMRDITSEQPSKIGEEIDKTIDHIFCKGPFKQNFKITTFNVLAGDKWGDGFVLGP